MALPIRMSAPPPGSTTPEYVDLPLACDPSMLAAHPAPPGGLSPLVRYLETSDADGLTIPDDASIATLRALSRQELRAASLSVRRREVDERVYDRVARSIADAAQRRLLEAVGVLPELRATEVRRALKTDRREALLTLSDAERAAVDAEAVRLEEVAGTPAGQVLDALSDEDHAAYVRHGRWSESYNEELVRRALVRLTAPPHDDWLADPRDGFPVAALLAQEGGREVVDELALHVVRVSDLGKAERGRRRSAGTSGGTSPGPRPGAAPTAPRAPATSTPPTSPSGGPGDGC